MNKKLEKRKVIELDNIRFYREVSGYFSNRLYGKYHRYIWEKENGKISEGYVIHHVDYKINGNRNNNIANLRCMTIKDHHRLHNSERNLTQETKDKIGNSNKGKIRSEEIKRKIGLSSIGNKNLVGYKHTLEALKKISESSKGNTNMLGYKHTKETKRKISEASKGIPLSEEHKMKIGNALRGRTRPEEVKQKMRGRIRTADHSRKLGLVHKDKKISEEHKLKISKKVKCIETNIIYKSLTDACESVMLKSSSSIVRSCKNTNKTAGGYHWEYA